MQGDMDLKGWKPSSLRGSNVRVRVWYVEDDQRTCYFGTVTKYAPTHGLLVWFDGMGQREQE